MQSQTQTHWLTVSVIILTTQAVLISSTSPSATHTQAIPQSQSETQTVAIHPQKLFSNDSGMNDSFLVGVGLPSSDSEPLAAAAAPSYSYSYKAGSPSAPGGRGLRQNMAMDYGPVNYGAPSFRPPGRGGGRGQSFDISSNSLSLGKGNGGGGGGHDYEGPPEDYDGDHDDYEEGPPRGGREGQPYLDNSILSGLNLYGDRVTLSGLSSGGGLAQQLLVSHPSLFSGAAIFQQTFYRCGRGNGDMEQFDNFCTNLGNESVTTSYDPRLAIQDIRSYFRHGLIEDPRNLRGKRLYVYAGFNNMILTLEQQLGLLRVFEPFIQNPAAIRTRIQNAASLLPTPNFGAACDEEAEENAFLGACGLSGPYEALSFLLGEHKIVAPPPRGHDHGHGHGGGGSLLQFDQSEFFARSGDHPGSQWRGRGQERGRGRAGHSMARVGYIYVPETCRGGVDGGHGRRCFLHIYFHGCRAGADVTDGRHIRFSGFLELAETNGIVVLFPQIETSPSNEIGCWDSFGYTGPLYATQRGVQVTIIRRMLGRILHGG